MTTKTIGIGGSHDYSSLSAWAAGLPANLVTDGNSQIGQCFFNGSGDGEFTSASTLLTLSGHTTDSSHTITLTTGAGQSFRDNANVQTNALTYNASNGVAIKLTGGYTSAIEVDDNYVEVSGLQVNCTSGQSCAFYEPNNIVTIDNCILQSPGRGGTGVIELFGSAIIRNSLVLLTGGTGPYILGLFDGAAAYNCTIAQCSDQTPIAIAIGAAYSNAILENCAVFGTTAVGTNAKITATTCMTNIASGNPTGFTGGKTYANQFIGTASSAPDFRAKAGADIIDAGTTDSTNGATDIAGTSRPQGSAYDIGCWELVVAAASRTPYNPWPLAAPILAQ